MFSNALVIDVRMVYRLSNLRMSRRINFRHATTCCRSGLLVDGHLVYLEIELK